MRGTQRIATRRTAVTIAASFAVVLGVGGVAAATGASGSPATSPAVTPAAVAHAHPAAHVKHAKTVKMRNARILADDPTTTTVGDDTSTTVVDDTSTTIDDETSTTVVGVTTTTTPDNDHKVCDHHGHDRDEDHDRAHEDHDGGRHGDDAVQTASGSHRHGSNSGRN
jgi:hypothetical protein